MWRASLGNEQSSPPGICIHGMRLPQREPNSAPQENEYKWVREADDQPCPSFLVSFGSAAPLERFDIKVEQTAAALVVVRKG